MDADPQDYETRVKSGDLDAVLVVDPNYATGLANGRPVTITLVTLSSRERSAPIAGRLASEVRSYANMIGNERMILRGIAPSVARPLLLEDLDLSSVEQRSARFLQMMSFYALFAGLMGAIAAALDVTAGERERQTLEPLLTTPVAVSELAIGKWLAVAMVNLLAVTASMLGFLIALQVVPLGKLGLPFNFGAREFTVHGGADPICFHGSRRVARVWRRGKDRKRGAKLAHASSIASGFVAAHQLVAPDQSALVGRLGAGERTVCRALESAAGRGDFAT